MGDLLQSATIASLSSVYGYPCEARRRGQGEEDLPPEAVDENSELPACYSSNKALRTNGKCITVTTITINALPVVRTDEILQSCQRT